MWFWLAVLVCLVVVGGVVIGFVRRWMKHDKTSVPVGFTLSDLRAMHARGEISKDELTRAEQSMISRIRGDAPSGRLQRSENLPDSGESSSNASTDEQSGREDQE